MRTAAGSLGISLLALGLAGISGAAQTDGSPVRPTVMADVWHGEAAAPVPQFTSQGPTRAGVQAQPRRVRASSRAGGGSAVVQAPSSRVMPAVTSWEGIGATGVLPPDPSGEAGPANFVQMVNGSGGSVYKVYDKAGTALTSTLSLASLWPGGSSCNADAAGDGLVLYDQTVDRWVLTQFTSTNSGPYYFCMAISKGADPISSGWWVYTFQTPSNRFPDYLKFAVWSDGYYMNANEFGDLKTDDGVGLWAIDRTPMLTGGAATTVYFHLPKAYYGLEPADIDGPTLPPAGEAEHFMAYDQKNANRLLMWDLHTDWVTPANSTITGPTSIKVADFVPDVCTNLYKCVPQPGTSVKLDSITDQIMYRLAYRNFGPSASLVVTHAVNVKDDRTGIRWYELTKPTAGSWTVNQQGTFSPDRTFRWIPSAATDKAGDIAIGYGASSSSAYPGIRYAGRLVSDRPDTLGQGEGVMQAGGGSQTSSYARWGDYSHMSIDPSDDCTFWFTSEYMSTTSQAGWKTRFGRFTFPSCNLSATSWVGALTGGYKTVGVNTFFHQGSRGAYTATLSPALPGASVTIWIDKYVRSSGSWTGVRSFGATLGGSSDATHGVNTRRLLRGRYRVAAHYDGDGSYQGSNATWSYFKVTT